MYYTLKKLIRSKRFNHGAHRITNICQDFQIIETFNNYRKRCMCRINNQGIDIFSHYSCRIFMKNPKVIRILKVSLLRHARFQAFNVIEMPKNLVVMTRASLTYVN